MQILLCTVRMIGPAATLPDICLQDLDQLYGNVDEPDIGQSSLSPDTPGEEESVREPVFLMLDPYKIKLDCPHCDRTLRFMVAATPRTIRNFQSLLLEDLTFICPACAKDSVPRNGR